MKSRYSILAIVLCIAVGVLLHKSTLFTNNNQESERYQEGSAPMPADEVEHWMNLIREIDPQAYEALEKAGPEKHFRYDKVPNVTVLDFGEDAPVIYIGRTQKDLPIEAQKNMLEWPLEHFTEFVILPLSEEEKEYWLNLIRTIDVQRGTNLYALFKDAEARGLKPIKRDPFDATGGSMDEAPDGSPVLNVGAELRNEPLDEQMWTLGHELTHYIEKHPSKTRRLHKQVERLNTLIADTVRKLFERRGWYLNDEEGDTPEVRAQKELNRQRYVKMILKIQASGYPALLAIENIYLQKTETEADIKPGKEFARGGIKNLQRSEVDDAPLMPGYPGQEWIKMGPLWRTHPTPRERIENLKRAYPQAEEAESEGEGE